MTQGHDAQPASGELTQLALSKLTRVLGPVRGPQVLAQVLAQAKLKEIRTPNELHAFGEQLAKLGGMEGAVGGLLSVAALLRGAVPPR